MSSNANSNPNIMDIEPGGEQTQYESMSTHVQPHAKEPGVLGASSTDRTKDLSPYSTPSSSSSSNDNDNDNDVTADPSEGEFLRETGLGGQTTGLSGGSSRIDQGTGAEDPVKARREQGLGGGRDMDRSIGA